MERPSFDRRSVLQTSGALVGASVLGLLGSSPAAASEGIETTGGETEPQYDLGPAEEFYVDVEMTFEEDGEAVTETPTLYGEIIRPVDESGDTVADTPVILTYSPYNDLYQALNAGDSPARDGIAEFFVPRGYARAQFDLIGTRNSGGYYDYGGIRERRSGAGLVDALGGMDWSNGNVGMIGGSYDGTTQLAAAIEAPDHLAAVVPQVAIDRWYDYRYHGGCPWDTFGTPTLFDFGFALVPPATVDHPEAFAGATTTRIEPGSRVEHEVRSYEYDPVYDDFWTERDYRRRAADVECPVLMEGGWEDRNVKRWADTRFFEALPDDHPKRLVAGDWGHAAGQYPDIVAIYHAWYDHWLVEGVTTDVMDLPPVDVESASTPRRQFADWPPADSGEVAFPLVRSDPGQFELELLGTSISTFRSGSPPVSEDEMFAERGSGDRHLMFETPPLEADLDVTGHVAADLLAASDGDAWFTATVYERDPEEGVRIFARGFWNSLYRNGIEEQSASTPTDGAYRLPVECWDINWRVSEGNRLGVVVASDNADWLRHDPRTQGTNQVVLGESALRFDSLDAGTVDVPTFPDVTLARDSGASVYTAGQTARVTVTAESASGDAFVRDRLPDGWTVVGGDPTRTVSVEGTAYVAFEDALAEGESLTYFAEAPDGPAATGSYTFGPLEYSATGDLWATAPGTTSTNAVVGADTEL